MKTVEEPGEVTLTLRDERGQGSVTVDIDDPWAGPWRRSMITGKPTSPWRGVGFRHRGVPYSLGFVSLTERSRVLWFPGANLAANEYVEDIDGQLSHFVGRPVDHLTIDSEFKPGHQRSHLTYVDGSHGPQVTHRHQRGTLTLWFSLLLPGTELLRTVPESLSVRFSAPRGDTDYPKQLAGKGSWELFEAIDDPAPPRFFQCDVWVGTWPGWRQDRFAFTPLAGLLGIADPTRDLVYPRLAMLPLSIDCGLGLVVSWVPGRLDKATMIRPSSVEGSVPELPTPPAT